MKTMNLYRILFRYGLTTFLLLIVTTATSQSLNDYLVLASKNNPKIKAAYTEFEAALQKTPQVSSLPDPTLTVSAFGQMIETRVGSQEARFNLMQMFPWFGTLEAKKEVANLNAEATFQKYVTVRNQVFFDLKKLYAEMYEVQQQIEFETENFKILDTYKTLALSKFKNGKGAMVDILRIDLKRNETEITIQLLNDQLKPLEFAFLKLVNTDEIFSIRPTSLKISNNYDVSFLTELAEQNSALKSLLTKIEAAKQEQKVIKKEGMPMIGLGIDYSIISKRNIPDLEMNGQDAIMPMLSVTLPIFRKKYKAKEKENELTQQQFFYEHLALKNELETNFKQTLFNIEKAEKLITLYKKQLQTTQQTIELLIVTYSNSNANFEEVLSLNQEEIQLKKAIISAEKNYFIAQAQLHNLLSKDNTL